MDSVGFLFAVSITPFSTRLLAEFIAYRIALLADWRNILLLGATLYFSWVCATASGLVQGDMAPEVLAASKRRVVIAPSLDGFGALLSVGSIYGSIGFMVLVQLNCAIAPRLPGRSRS